MGTISEEINRIPEVKSLKSGGLVKPKTIDEYSLALESDFKVKKQNMIEEFRDRENMMLAIIDVKLTEYEMISTILTVNSQLNKNKPNPATILKVSEYLAEINFDTAMSSISLKVWEKELGKQYLMPVISDIVHYFIRQFKVKECVTDIEILQYSIDLMLRNPEMRIKELIMIFRDALSGKFGSTWQRIGIDTLYEWESKYFERASQHLETKVSYEKVGESRGHIAIDPMETRLKSYEKEIRLKKEISDKYFKREQNRNELLNRKTD